MDIIIENNVFKFNNKEFMCSIGKNGFTSNKVEGDGCTPNGIYKFKEVFYREDKIKDLNFLIESKIIKKESGWCDDINSDLYNKYIEFPFAFSAEHLFREDDLYDLIYVINYNTDPIVKNKGSAIFLHIANPDYAPTEGCIALKKEDLIEISGNLKSDTRLIINT